MTILVDFESQTPIYQQIRTGIIKAISKKEVKGGDVLPSIRQLAVDLGINMHTVGKAYTMLKNDGYIQINTRGAVKVALDINIDESTMTKISDLINNAAIEAVGKNLSRHEFLSICERSFKESGGKLI